MHTVTHADNLTLAHACKPWSLSRNSHEGRTYLSVKFVVTEIKRGINGFERLKVNVDFLLFAFFSHDGATVNYQTVWGHCKIYI